MVCTRFDGRGHLPRVLSDYHFGAAMMELRPGDEVTVCLEDDADILVRVTREAVHLLRRYPELKHGEPTGYMVVDLEAGLSLTHEQAHELAGALACCTTKVQPGRVT